MYIMNNQYRSWYPQDGFWINIWTEQIICRLGIHEDMPAWIMGMKWFFFILKELKINFWRKSTFSICTIGFVNDSRFQTSQVCELSIILIYLIKSYSSELWVFLVKNYFCNFTDIVKMKWRSVYTAKMFQGKI